MLMDNDTNFVIVPGGSVFADIVKEFQLNTGIGDDVVHWMAIKAMEIYGLFLKNFEKRCEEVNDLEDVYKVLRNKHIPIVMPYKILKKYNELPYSWSVTSDSISIYLAYLLQAKLVALGKIIDGITTPDGKIVKTIYADDLARYRTPVIDDYVPTFVNRYKIATAIFNITKPWILEKIVKMETNNYTLILPSSK